MNRFRSITLLFLALASLGATVSGDEKPNIIVIFTDDQGYSDLGVQGVRCKNVFLTNPSMNDS